MKPIERERKRTFRRWSGKRFEKVYDYRGRLWFTPKTFKFDYSFKYFVDSMIACKQLGLYELREKGIRR